MDAADGRLVAGIAEWLFGEVLLDVRVNRPIRDRCRSGRSSGGLGRADGRDVVVDGMLRRDAGKSARYAGVLVVPVTLDSVTILSAKF